MNRSPIQPDPRFDLVLERSVDVPRELVWQAWTQPEHLKKWFTPAPWTTIDCEIDLRPGGRFRTVMRSPDGQEYPNVACYLEIVENERLVWTSVLAPGYRPTIPTGQKECDVLAFTAAILMERNGKGTKYTAIAIHGDEITRKKHAQMGFHDGWATAFDQLVAMVRNL